MCVCTNLNQKGLQRTANEYVEERRIYKDLISKNNDVDILNSALQNTAMLIVLRLVLCLVLLLFKVSQHFDSPNSLL